MDNEQHTNSYFAAANGYSGFRSYFAEIFAPEKFDKIYVLKGGPGTGKSSFMKRLRSALCESGYEVESVLCSSDPRSLDGVVASANDHRVAILDGTAPHERDAILPGAKDELIPLGNLWDSRYLYGSRERICELSSAKSKAYKAAYAYLKIAGATQEARQRMICSSFDEICAKKHIKNLAESSLAIEEADLSHRLLSAFCKDGYVKPDGIIDQSIRKITVGSDRDRSTHYISVLWRYLDSVGVKCTLIHSPFLDAELEGLYFPKSGILLSVTDSNECDILADEFFVTVPEDTEQIRVAGLLRQYSLDDAARWFAIASDLHFRLEKIYTTAMNFEKIEEIYARVLTEMTDILK